jgi:hypothetical protein
MEGYYLDSTKLLSFELVQSQKEKDPHSDTTFDNLCFIIQSLAPTRRCIFLAIIFRRSTMLRHSTSGFAGHMHLDRCESELTIL